MIITICDLDGTIADDRHRLPLIGEGPNKYDAYHAKCGEDRFMNPGCLADPRWAVIITARPTTVHAQTWAWLMEGDVWPWMLCMRAAGDTRPAVQVKEDFLREVLATLQHLPEHNYTIIAYDDQDDILAMYRRYGIRTVKVGYDTP